MTSRKNIDAITKESQMSPKLSKGGKKRQEIITAGSQMSPKRHNGRKKDQKWLQKGPKCHQKDQKWSQKGPKCHQNGTQKEAMGLKRSPKRRPKVTKKDPKDQKKNIGAFVYFQRYRFFTTLQK